MSNEPIYVDDPFDEEDHWWEPKNGTQYYNLLMQAMAVCRKNKFASRKERTRWMKIESKLSKKQLTDEWVLDRIELARKLNMNAFKMSFYKLESAILNMGRYQDWVAEKRTGNVPVDRTSYADNL